MNRNFICITFIFQLFCPCIFADAEQSQSADLNDIRSRFSQAVKSEESCLNLYNEMMQQKGKQSATFNCYLGVVTVSMAKYTSNLFTKLDYFQSGKKLIEAAIKDEPYNVELRFLRYTIQEHVPFFLDYSSDLDADKKMIMESLEFLNMPKLKEAIINYIVNSESFSDEEKRRAKSYR